MKGILKELPVPTWKVELMSNDQRLVIVRRGKFLKKYYRYGFRMVASLEKALQWNMDCENDALSQLEKLKGAESPLRNMDLCLARVTTTIEVLC